jgi:MYXO-CTERM domain-containing protein
MLMKSSLTFAFMLLLSSALHAQPSGGIIATPMAAGPTSGDRVVSSHVVSNHNGTAPHAAPVKLVRTGEKSHNSPVNAETSADDERHSGGVADPSAVALLGLGLLILAALRRRTSRE